MKNIVLIYLLLLPTLLSAQQSEAAYIQQISELWNARTEISVTSGRVDILTNTHAIEVERANKWKNAIGQSLWYGLQMNTKPGIILILEHPSDYKYYIQLNTALDYAGLTDKIKVWVFPNDFPDISTPADHTPTNTGYWLTKSSKLRHNSSCQYYHTTRGQECSAEDGRACRVCGG